MIWMRTGWTKIVMDRGGAVEDIGEIVDNVARAAKAGKEIPKDKFGAWEFFSLTEPGEDN